MKAAVQKAIPEPQTVVGLPVRHDSFHKHWEAPRLEHGHDFQAVELFHRDVERALHSGPAREVRPRNVAALLMDFVAHSKVQGMMMRLNLCDGLDQLFQVQEAEMAQLVVPELLVDVDEVFAAGMSIDSPLELALVLGEIGGEDVRHIQILRVHFQATGLGSNVMNMNVAAIPSQ